MSPSLTCLLVVLVLCANLSPAESTKDEEVHNLISRVKQLSDIRTVASAPFRMKIDFQITNKDSTETTGRYTEIWASPDKWRRETVSGDFRTLVVTNGDKTWASDTPDPIPARIAELGFRMDSSLFASESWVDKVEDRQIDSVSLRCVESRVDAMGNRSALCFDKGSGLLSAKVTLEPTDLTLLTCTYSAYENLGGRAVPQITQCSEHGDLVFESTLVELTTQTVLDPGLFTAEEIMKWTKEDINCRGNKTPPKAIYAPAPVPHRWDSKRPENNTVL